MGVLTITLNKIEHLRDKDKLGKSDPYVVFQLEKDRLVFDRDYGKKESSKKRNDCNPVYNETFTFHDVDNLNNMQLIVKVMDDDIGFDDKIGQSEVDLEHALLTSTPKEVVAVIDKKRFKIFQQEATIHLLLSFTK